jgi:hypothetical protein
VWLTLDPDLDPTCRVETTATELAREPQPSNAEGSVSVWTGQPHGEQRAHNGALSHTAAPRPYAKVPETLELLVSSDATSRGNTSSQKQRITVAL